MIHGFSTSHGDPFVGAFAERMLSHVTRPFYDMLRQWIYDGELSDPYHEFFVTENASPDASEDPRRAATSVWEEKYKLDEAMIPSIITKDFAHKVFLIGKSLNFIRYSCGDSPWVEAYCKETSQELRYGDTATLETSIDAAYKATMARLTHLMDTKFHLTTHLHALKRYLLLGQGDFIALLMESLSTNLDRPAGSQYRHTLTAQLEHSIRNSNAQHDPPDILRRLDARLTEMEKGDTGWDVFTLEYKIDPPVDVLITPWANRQYLKIFHLLWRIKRVEFGLGATWRRCMTGARGVLALTPSSPTAPDWKRARCAIAEMIHFITQLQYYILVEVVEAAWTTLATTLASPSATFDDLIAAHTAYLKTITHKALLGSSSSSRTGTNSSSSSTQRDDIFTAQLHELLKIMLAYKDAVDGLYSLSVAAFIRSQELAARIETRTAQGKWGLTESDDRPPSSSSATPAAGSRTTTDSPLPNPLAALGLHSSSADVGRGGGGGAGDDMQTLLPPLRGRLGELSAEFQKRVCALLGDLAVQPDVDVRFLGVVMNFNEVYVPRKRRRERGVNAEKKTPVAGPKEVGDGGEGGGEKKVEEEKVGEGKRAGGEKKSGATTVGGGGGRRGGAIGAAAKVAVK